MGKKETNKKNLKWKLNECVEKIKNVKKGAPNYIANHKRIKANKILQNKIKQTKKQRKKMKKANL